MKYDENKYTSGIGILCNIPAKNIKALITYNNLINLDFLNKGEKLLLYINKKEHEINIKINRYKYTDEEFDITIIEILDIDNVKNFIEIDKFINSRNYAESDIISCSLTKDKELDLSYGKIIEKNKGNYIIDIESKKEGIIILKDNMKLIGLLKTNINNTNKIGLIPMNVIINKINFIKCIYNVTKKDINRDIQIINNKKKENSGNNRKNDEIEKEIRVIIEGEIKSNILKYKFNKEGEYIIYLIAINYLTNISFMFYNCSSIKEINLSSFNTNQVTNMSCMFLGCSSLENLNLSSINTKTVTDMSCMFLGCSSLVILDLSLFDTNHVINMSSMFLGCSSLEILNISSFVTNQVINMSAMFNDCSSLKELNLSLFNTNKE